MVSRSIEGPVHRTTYAEIEGRAKRLVNALGRLGVAPGERVATMAWNGYRHFELFFGIPGAGAVQDDFAARVPGVSASSFMRRADDEFGRRTSEPRAQASGIAPVQPGACA